MNKSTLGLDFGADYTKIAYRPVFPVQIKGIHVKQSCDVISFDSSILIPSIVIRTSSKKKEWLFGMEAAGVTPANDWEVFRNWKSDIFSSKFSDNMAVMNEVAVAFFSWLLNKISSPPCNIEAVDRVRFSVPELGDVSKQKCFFRNCLINSGWTGDIDFVKEPIANATGTFSGGKNYVSGFGKISYGPMFGNHAINEMNFIINEIVAYVVNKTRSERYLKTAIVDCGGFTVDAAMLKLDLRVTEHDGLPFSVLESRSKEIGVVKQIDDIALKYLLDTHGINIATVPFETLELAKHNLYASSPYRMFHESRIIELGDSTSDKNIVADTLDNYCKLVWKNISILNWNNVEHVILTGGGLNIVHVRKYLQSNLKKLGITNVFCFSEHTRPESNIYEYGLLTSEEYTHVFGRVATAIGNSSIAFGFNK